MMYGVLSIYNFDDSVPSIKLTIEKIPPSKEFFYSCCGGSTLCCENSFLIL